MSEEKYKEQVDEKSDISNLVEIVAEKKEDDSFSEAKEVIAAYLVKYELACSDMSYGDSPAYIEKLVQFKTYMKNGKFTSFNKLDNNSGSYDPYNFISNGDKNLRLFMDQLCRDISDVWRDTLNRTDKQIMALKEYYENSGVVRYANAFKILIAWKINREFNNKIIDRAKLKNKIMSFKWLFQCDKEYLLMKDDSKDWTVVKYYNDAFEYHDLISRINNDRFTQQCFLGTKIRIPRYIGFEDIDAFIERKTRDDGHPLKDNYISMYDKMYTTIRSKNIMAALGITIAFALQILNVIFEDDKRKMAVNIIALVLFVLFSLLSMNISSINDYDSAYMENISDTLKDFDDVTLLMFKNPKKYGCGKNFLAKLFLLGGHRFMCSRKPAQ